MSERNSPTVLSQLAYQKKYIIAMDPIFHDQFIFAKNDFNRYLTEAENIADTSEKRNLLSRIRIAYGQYQMLITEEIDQINAKRSYSKYEYDQTKEKLVREILEELRTLETQSQEEFLRGRTDSGRQPPKHFDW